MANLLEDNVDAIFNKGGYPDDWQAETAKTRLPNFKVGVEAVDHVAAAKAVSFKTCADTFTIEVRTMMKMLVTGIIPAYAKDLRAIQLKAMWT